jgi:hypothetical protein
MPLLADREFRALGGGETQTTFGAQMSSHDAYGFCMDILARRSDPVVNQARFQAQIQCYKQHRAALCSMELPSSYEDTSKVRAIANRVYARFCRFTYDHLNTYFPESDHRIGFAFATMDDLDSTMHLKLCQWLAGREILQGKNPDAKAEDHAWKDPMRLYCECADIIKEYEETKVGLEEMEEVEEGMGLSRPLDASSMLIGNDADAVQVADM